MREREANGYQMEDPPGPNLRTLVSVIVAVMITAVVVALLRVVFGL